MKQRDYSIADLIDSLIWETEQYDDETGFTKGELTLIAQQCIADLGAEFCFGCDADCIETGERYMVHDELWRAYGTTGMLCVGCFERRLGRQLTTTDFTECGLNSDPDYPRSERLLERLRSEQITKAVGAV